MALGWAVSGVRVCAPILCGTCNGVGLLSVGVRNRAINFFGGGIVVDVSDEWPAGWPELLHDFVWVDEDSVLSPWH